MQAIRVIIIVNKSCMNAKNYIAYYLSYTQHVNNSGIHSSAAVVGRMFAKKSLKALYPNYIRFSMPLLKYRPAAG
jgi:hypothetical protein